MERNAGVCVLLVLLLAAALRFYDLDWDGGIGAHPDERYVVGVATGLRWPGRLNPFDLCPDFAYGHLPLYLLALAGDCVRGVDPLLTGRVLATFLDLGAVGMTFALGRRVYSARVGLLAAALVALTLLHVQQAHFYTADALLPFLVLGALCFAVRLAERGRPLDAWLAGAWAGLALGTKFSAALLVLPLGAACALAPRARRVRWRCALASGGAALIAFALTNPFALLAFPVFWHNVTREAAIARGALDVPYTRQFRDTWPYLYPILQQLRWGMGCPLGLAAFGGLAHGIWRAVREPPRRAEWILLAWALPCFAFVGGLYAKFPRYLLPLAPLLALYGARLLSPSPHLPAPSPGLRQERGRPRGLRAGLGTILAGLCLAGSFLRCLAFVAIYRAPHPWLLASEWFYDHVAEGTVIAVEQWDHPLPLAAAGRPTYDVREVPIFEEDTPEKWVVVERVLAEADYVVIASRRGYGALARWPERYPLTARYYSRLFDGELGFEPVACFGRAPRLGPLVLTDDATAGLAFSLPEICRPRSAVVLPVGRLDESLVVYDHPQVIVFAKRSSSPEG